MVRILYFSRDYSTHDHRFLSALAKTEHEVAFLQLERRGRTLDDRPLPPEIQQIPWIGGQSLVNLRDGPKLVVALRRIIRGFRPDLIQAGPVQRSAFLVALCGFRPLVTMSWGYDLLHDVHYGRAWEWATRFTLKRTSVLVGDCDTIRNLAIQYGMDAERIITFPWGANIQRFTPTENKAQVTVRQRLGWDENAFVLLSTRGWESIYGVDDLAKAFVRAAGQHPELRLFMLGNGSLAPTIRRIFQQGGVMDLVHFPGHVPQEKLPDFYRAADLYISTSHSDGTSISMLESLASGTPVLLTDIPGNREWIPSPSPAPPEHPLPLLDGVPGEGGGRGVGEDKVGWLFKDGDVQSLTNGILYAVENRKQLSAMGRVARQLAEARGDWEQNFPNLFKAYEIALKS